MSYRRFRQANHRRRPLEFVGVGFLAVSSGGDFSDGMGNGLFGASPEGNVFVDDVDVVPFMEGLSVGVIEFVVEHCSTPVFHSVFEGCNGEDYDYWDGAEAGIRCAEDGEYLQELGGPDWKENANKDAGLRGEWRTERGRYL